MVSAMTSMAVGFAIDAAGGTPASTSSAASLNPLCTASLALLSPSATDMKDTLAVGFLVKQ